MLNAAQTDGPPPFQPPDPAYVFEDEFRPEPPRPIPPILRYGPYAQAAWRAASGCVTAGLVCVAVAPTPPVQHVALFLLPLHYLDWIGYFLIALGVLWPLMKLFGKTPYRYVTHGTPVAARVVELALVPHGNFEGQPADFRYTALLHYRDPHTGEERSAVTASPQGTNTDPKTTDVTFRAGDTVTAVLMPGEKPDAPQIYAFQGLRDGVGVVRKGGPGGSALGTALAVLVVFACIGGVFACLYALLRYFPLDVSGTSYAILFSVGAVMAVVEVGLLALSQRQAATPDAFQFNMGGIFGTLFLFLGAVLMNTTAVMCVLFAVNALGDAGAAKERPVAVQELVHVTHNLVFREYRIKYRFIDDILDAEKHEFASSPAHMRPFLERRVPVGVAEVCPGLLGWQWVRDVRPAVVPGAAPPPPDADADRE